MMFFFLKQKTAYERRISDWSSDVCSSDLALGQLAHALARLELGIGEEAFAAGAVEARVHAGDEVDGFADPDPARQHGDVGDEADIVHQLVALGARVAARSEEHTSELQSLMRISYAAFCFKQNIRRWIADS